MKIDKFIGRKDRYAIQQTSGAYFVVNKPIDDKVLKEHLDGLKTIATYVLDENNMVSFGCIDVDVEISELDEALKLSEHIYSLFPEFERALEFSGRRGYHIWIFLKQKEPAEFVKDLINTRLRMYGYNKIEVFPKQIKLSGKGYGNCVKVPMGIHKRSGKRSKILRNDNAKV